VAELGAADGEALLFDAVVQGADLALLDPADLVEAVAGLALGAAHHGGIVGLGLVVDDEAADPADEGAPFLALEEIEVGGWRR
jgi:hypothetical protein